MVTSKKPALIFLHGWGRTGTDWLPVQKKLSGFTTFAPTLPGFDQKLDKPLLLADYTRFLHYFALNHGLKKFILVGHSFGGQVALDFAIHYPQLLTHLVLVDSANLRTTTDPKIKLTKTIASNLSKILPGSLLKPLRRLTGLDQTDYYLTTNSDPHLRQTLKNILSQDQTPYLAQLRLPVLLFWGTNDLATPLAQAQFLHSQITTSKLITVNAGHFSFQEQPAKFISELKTFTHDN